MRRTTLGIVLGLWGCAGGEPSPGDGRDDTFGGSGKADVVAVEDGSAEARGVLRVANELDVQTLRSAVRLTKRAATGIVAHRRGPDGLLSTEDDDRFDTLDELDLVPYVGQAALDRMLSYADRQGWIEDEGDEGVCAEHHAGQTADGEPVEVCTVLHPTAPYVRPPADEIVDTGVSTLHVGLELAGFTGVVDRGGVRYRILGPDGLPVSASDLDRALPESMRMPSNRNLYLVYRVRGRLGQNHGEPTIWVSEGTPEVLVTARALDGTFRTWEGTVSKRLTDHSFDIDERVPVRIDLDRLEPLSNLAEWSSGTLADGERFDLVGRVSNLHEAVRAADGTCIPATDALGTADPFAGATEDRIALRRIAGMHITGDQVIVVQYPSGTAGLSQTGMTGLLLHHPAGLLQGEPAPDWTEHEFWPHGTPNGHTLSIHPVVGGGGSCP